MRKSLHIALSAHRLLCSVSAVVLPANMYGENLSGFWSMSSTQAWLNSATEDWSSSVLAVVLDIQVKTFDMTIRVVHETWHTPLKRKKTWSVHGWRSSNTSNMKQVGTFLDAIRVSKSASERKSPFFELFSNHRGLFRFPPNFQYNVFQFHYLKSNTVLDQLM